MSKILLKMESNLLLFVKVYSILNKILLFLQCDSLFYSIFFTVYVAHTQFRFKKKEKKR